MADKDTKELVRASAEELGRAVRGQGYSLTARTDRELARMEAEEARGSKPQAQEPQVPAGQGSLGHMSDKDRAAMQAARAAMANAMMGDCRDAEDRIACMRGSGGKKPTTGHSK